MSIYSYPFFNTFFFLVPSDDFKSFSLAIFSMSFSYLEGFLVPPIILTFLSPTFTKASPSYNSYLTCSSYFSSSFCYSSLFSISTSFYSSSSFFSVSLKLLLSSLFFFVCFVAFLLLLLFFGFFFKIGLSKS